MHSVVITNFLRPIYVTTFVTCICAYDGELYHVSQTYDNCSFLYPVGLIYTTQVTGFDNDVRCKNVAFKSVLQVTLTVITYSVITVKPSVTNKVLTDFELPL